ncbi:hypothetical protein B0G57_116120 [Trinickia symbiotica]|uniref:Uncharacterized protein n=1 Tax=Trinickia symbiotica TaxID=863227 RepID=A0A2N7X706_9BURK|nr:hypothetical protein [Trinickia symbiotica]PMS37332.1 hypothetical protein C0Z20_08425 [Trinickia symbiotica]PPK42869.1 hypothetical protein B0G57_116120 [Trinickia symbiotica]
MNACVNPRKAALIAVIVALAMTGGASAAWLIGGLGERLRAALLDRGSASLPRADAEPYR